MVNVIVGILYAMIVVQNYPFRACLCNAMVPHSREKQFQTTPTDTNRKRIFFFFLILGIEENCFKNFLLPWRKAHQTMENLYVWKRRLFT